MTAPKVIWAEPGMPGYTDELCASYTVRYIRADAPELVALVDAAKRSERFITALGKLADTDMSRNPALCELISALATYEALK